jgi:hypothetical protein
MKELQYSAYYKFLVSLGLAIIVLAFTVPWLLLREPLSLEMKNSELSNLTPRGRRVVHQRQMFAETSGKIAPWASVALLVLGSGLIIYGLGRWNDRQKIVDRTEDTTLVKLEAEVRQLTTNEAEERVEDEAKETADAHAVAKNEAAGTAATREHPYLETVATLFALERLAIRKLEEAFKATHTVEDRIAIGNERLDARLVSKSSGTDYLVEIKFFKAGAAVLCQRAVRQISRAAITYRRSSERDVTALLLIIVGNESTASGEDNRVSYAKRLESVQAVIDKARREEPVDIRTLVLGEEEFIDISAHDLKRKLQAA